MKFNPYPFERLRILLKDSNPHKSGINLSIGEPAFQAPDSVIKAICTNAQDIRYYPSLQQELIESQKEFMARRFHIALQDSQIIPTFGSREVLFNFPHFLCFSYFSTLQSNGSNRQKPVMAYPNPFYQIYEGAQIANNADVIYMPLTKENNFKPHLLAQDLERVNIVILNSPNNPTGQILSLEELQQWVQYALEYDFILINDECYSEIYENTAPPSILEASIMAKNAEFKNIFAINSLSKRLSAPGLRSGFIAGDSHILQDYKTFRSYVGISMPLVLQKAATTAWKEDKYAAYIRDKFAENLKIARNIFSLSIMNANVCNIFPYTFYLWLDVSFYSAGKQHDLSNDEYFTKELFLHTGHVILPGSYLGRRNAGKGFVRIALTQEPEIMQNVLLEIQAFYKDNMQSNAQ